jgi:hypothetical protein
MTISAAQIRERRRAVHASQAFATLAIRTFRRIVIPPAAYRLSRMTPKGHRKPHVFHLSAGTSRRSDFRSPGRPACRLSGGMNTPTVHRFTRSLRFPYADVNVCRSTEAHPLGSRTGAIAPQGRPIRYSPFALGVPQKSNHEVVCRLPPVVLRELTTLENLLPSRFFLDNLDNVH